MAGMLLQPFFNPVSQSKEAYNQRMMVENPNNRAMQRGEFWYSDYGTYLVARSMEAYHHIQHGQVRDTQWGDL